MGINNKTVTITLRMDEHTKERLDSLSKIETEHLKEKGFSWEKTVNSKLIRCLIDAVYNMPLETKRELITKYYRRW